MAKITIYTTQNCPYCVMAKNLLSQRGIAYDEVVLGWNNSAAWDALMSRSGMKTVPQIFHGDQLIGGYSELAVCDQKDRLDSFKSTT